MNKLISLIVAVVSAVCANAASATATYINPDLVQFVVQECDSADKRMLSEPGRQKCEYVRAISSSGCISRGNCPTFEEWRQHRVSGRRSEVAADGGGQ